MHGFLRAAAAATALLASMLPAFAEDWIYYPLSDATGGLHALRWLRADQSLLLDFGCKTSDDLVFTVVSQTGDVPEPQDGDVGLALTFVLGDRSIGSDAEFLSSESANLTGARTIYGDYTRKMLEAAMATSGDVWITIEAVPSGGKSAYRLPTDGFAGAAAAFLAGCDS